MTDMNAAPYGEVWFDDDDPETGNNVWAEFEGQSDELDEEAVALDALGLYLKRIGNTPLLNAEQEVELAKRIEVGWFASHLLEQTGIEVQSHISQIRTQKTETSEAVDDADTETPAEQIVGDEDAAQEQYVEDLRTLVSEGDAAFERMQAANLRLVVNLAKSYKGRGLPFSDVIQEGSFGLRRAVEKFDYTKGYKFSTYATWWIRQSILRGIADTGRDIRLPVHKVEQLSVLTGIERRLTAELNREPSDDELARELSKSTEEVAKLRALQPRTLSLSEPVGEQGDGEFGDFIVEDGAVDLTDHVTRMDTNNNVQALLRTLDDRERDIIISRAGVFGPAETLEAIGRRHGVTRERVRQIESKTMKLLRSHAEESGLFKDRDV